MQTAKEEETLEHASAFQNTLETLTKLAGRSVLCTLTAPQTEHAKETSASTRAPEHVAAMQDAES